jgi:hypothetical protein
MVGQPKSHQQTADTVDQAVGVAHVEPRADLLAGHELAGVGLARANAELVEADGFSEMLNLRQGLCDAHGQSSRLQRFGVLTRRIGQRSPDHEVGDDVTVTHRRV